MTQLLHFYLNRPVYAGAAAVCGHIHEGPPIFHDESGPHCPVCTRFADAHDAVAQDAVGSSDTALILGQVISDMVTTLDEAFELDLSDADLVEWIVQLMPPLALQVGARRKARR